MRNSELMCAIGLITALATLAWCAGKIRFPSYYSVAVLWEQKLEGRKDIEDV